MTHLYTLCCFALGACLLALSSLWWLAPWAAALCVACVWARLANEEV